MKYYTQQLILTIVPFLIRMCGSRSGSRWSSRPFRSPLGSALPIWSVLLNAVKWDESANLTESLKWGEPLWRGAEGAWWHICLEEADSPYSPCFATGFLGDRQGLVRGFIWFFQVIFSVILIFLMKVKFITIVRIYLFSYIIRVI